MSNPIPQSPLKTSKKTLIIISTIIGLVLLTVIAGSIIYQSMKTSDASKSTNSSSVKSVDTMSKGESMSVNNSISSSSTTQTSVSNLTRFTDAQLPGFSFGYPTGWNVEVAKFSEANGSGGPGGEFYTKKILLKKDNITIDIDINTSGRSGIGFPDCYSKDSKIITGKKYTIITDENNGLIVEPNQNIAKSSDPDFAKYFAASGDIVSDPNTKVADYIACIKSSTVYTKIKTDLKDTKGNMINEGYISFSPSGVNSEILSIIDSTEGITL